MFNFALASIGFLFFNDLIIYRNGNVSRHRDALYFFPLDILGWMWLISYFSYFWDQLLCQIWPFFLFLGIFLLLYWKMPQALTLADTIYACEVVLSHIGRQDFMESRPYLSSLFSRPSHLAPSPASVSFSSHLSPGGSWVLLTDTWQSIPYMVHYPIGPGQK